EARQAEGRRLSRIANHEEGKIVFYGDTNAEQLDKYLAAKIAMYQWVAHHPTTIDHKTAEAENAREKALKYTKILTGSYYTEKALFCQEQADTLSKLAGDGTDDLGIQG